MLVSYDYAFLHYSLPLIYEHADRITLAVDRACRTWTGIPFAIEDSFWNWIKEIDVQKKIDVYRDDFYLPELTAMQNQTRERNMIGRHMGEGGWHVQVDSDEYFPDFGAFTRFLRRHSRWTAQDAAPIDIGAFLIPLFKKFNDGFLYIPNAYETFVIATNRPNYKLARQSSHRILYAPCSLFHQTWARSEEEIWTKVNNFGARTEFHVQSYYNLWKSIDRHNYRYIRDFHPLIPEVWRQLTWGPGKDIPEFIRNYRQDHPLTVPMRVYLRRRLGQFKKSWFRRD